MLERASLLKIAMAAVFAASLAALPLTLSAQETTEPATKADPAAKAKKKATTKATAKSKAAETTPGEPKTTQKEPVDPPATTTDAKGKQLSPGQIAVRERQRKCGAEWRGLSKEDQAKKGGTWPKYWSACNTRLKAEAQPAGKKG
jgi:hypothetical protein